MTWYSSEICHLRSPGTRPRSHGPRLIHRHLKRWAARTESKTENMIVGYVDSSVSCLSEPSTPLTPLFPFNKSSFPRLSSVFS